MSETLLDTIAYHYRQMAHHNAQFLRTLADFAERRPPERPDIDIGDGAAEEIALELDINPITAARHLVPAQAMVARLPATLNALDSGEIDYMRAKAVHDYTHELNDDQAGQVEKHVLDSGPRANLTRFKLALRREVIRVDPDAAEHRRRDSKADRNVTAQQRPDGMVVLDVVLEPHEAQAVYDRINLLAHHAKTSERGLGQCRADVFIDLVMGKNARRPAVTMNVMVPMTTLMGLNREPGEISGYGPIAAEYARELAQHAAWRRVITDPTGQVLEVSRRRFAGPALRRYIQLRDRTCRQPGCTTIAEHTEIDHTTPHTHGGLTGPGHVAAMCKRHNLMRQRADWTLEQPLPGTLIFKTPAKRLLVTTPEPYDMPPF